MLDKRLLWTGVSVLIVSAVAVVAALFPQQRPADIEAAPIQETVSDVEISQESPARDEPPEEQTYEYLIREYEGRIAVYRWGEDEPYTVFDKLVKHLPEYDRIQMEEGIEVGSYSELTARIEDFIS